MKRIKFALPFIALIISVGGCRSDKGTTFRLYYLGGQSNMDGYGYVDSLPPDLSGAFTEVYIFHGNASPDDAPVDGKGIWDVLKPGHGAGFKSTGDTNILSNRFGVELSFARELKVLNPGEKIAIIKYSRGGSSIDSEAAGNFGCWDPNYSDSTGINQYDHFLATVRNALSVKDIDGDGIDDTLIPSGIIWMQGESDGTVSETVARRYYDNLAGLMSLIRSALGGSDIPVVVGRISDSGNDPSGKVWEWGDIIREAQTRFAQSDLFAAMVTSTDNYAYSDPWHYNSAAYIDLGRQFAIAVDSLNAERD